MSATADIVIVGAGPYGLSCAWWIKQKQPGVDVVVLDAGDFAVGGGGRNGSGMRMQWGLELNIRLCQESIAFFEDVETRLDYPPGIELKQEGYLLLAHEQQVFEQLQSGYQRQQKLGVPSEVLSAADCLKIVPGLNPERLVGGTFCHKDGTASPFRWLDALLQASRRSGVEVRFMTRVERLSSSGNEFIVSTQHGDISAAKVLLCTDWAAPELLHPLGIDIPISGMPKQGFVTEAWRSTLGPMIVSFLHEMTINQVQRGNFVVIAAQDRPDGDDIQSTPGFLHHAASQVLDCMPGLGRVKVVRTWGGVISKTPDMQAVLGEMAIPGLYLAVSAYKGFMTSPAVGRIMAELMFDSSSRPHPEAAPFSAERFDTGELMPEPTTV